MRRRPAPRRSQTPRRQSLHQADAEREKTYRPRKAIYAKRPLLERFFNRLKHFRAIANRFEKHTARYLALVKPASARLWMRFMSP